MSHEHWAKSGSTKCHYFRNNCTCCHFKIDHVPHELGFHFKEVIIVIAFFSYSSVESPRRHTENQFVSTLLATFRIPWAGWHSISFLCSLRYNNKNLRAGKYESASRKNVITMNAPVKALLYRLSNFQLSSARRLFRKDISRISKPLARLKIVKPEEFNFLDLYEFSNCTPPLLTFDPVVLNLSPRVVKVKEIHLMIDNIRDSNRNSNRLCTPGRA